MRILKPNTGEEVVCIPKQHLYVKITDFGAITFLKEIKVGLAQHSWEWINFRTDKCLDLSGINNKYCSFGHAINRSVNDLYCIVYEFDDWHEAIKNWHDIKYVDNIKTVYQEEKK